MLSEMGGLQVAIGKSCNGFGKNWIDYSIQAKLNTWNYLPAEISIMLSMCGDAISYFLLDQIVW